MINHETKHLAGALMEMAHSPVHNYAIPGLTSYLIGKEEPGRGLVRMFHSERDHQEEITPHSHRFGFVCQVLVGSVINRVWERNEGGDQFLETRLTYCDQIGDYSRESGTVDRWIHRDQEYLAGDVYSMRAEEVHSIKFSRGAVVLFFEFPTTNSQSVILEPWVDDQHIRTMEVKPWMFKRG